MPSVGMPSSNSEGSSRGAPSAYTEAGPPDRISAEGLRLRRSSTDERCETSSEYTRASRTRRAISCEYWPPRSTTRTGRSSLLAAAVIWRVLRDRHVVRVRLAQPRAGDPNELRVVQRLDRRGTAVPHCLAQAADDLVQNAADRALVGHARLDPFGHELVDVFDVALEVAVLRIAARLHRPERPHAAKFLEALALDD